MTRTLMLHKRYEEAFIADMIRADFVLSASLRGHVVRPEDVQVIFDAEGNATAETEIDETDG